MDWPALPAPAPSTSTWSLDSDALFRSGSYDVPALPAATGRIAGVTSAGLFTAYDATTGRQVWSTTLPAVAGSEPADDTPLVSALQAPGVNLLAVDRKIASATDPVGNDQIDVVDGDTGRFLWSRTGNRLSAPQLLDARHALFDLTSGSQEHGLDMVDPATGQVRWHNPDVAACSAYVGQVLCDTSDARGIALVDPGTGATRWTTAYPETIQGAASSFRAIVGGQAYLGDGQTSTLTAVDLATGQVRWRHDTGIGLLTQAFPLDSGHVAVAGLRTTPTGSTEQLVAADVATGTTSVLYAGTATDGTNTSNGGVDLIRLGDRHYFVVVDPDGTIHTLDATGRQLASAPSACGGGAASVVGDTVACPSNGVLTLYAVPDLSRRSAIHFDASKVASFHVFGNTCALEESGRLTGLK